MGDTPQTSMIKVSQLTKWYGDICALSDVNFEVRKGEIVGFLGPNGAGKSTCLKIMTCFLAPTSGSVAIAGTDVQDAAKTVRQRFGYVPENAPLYMDMITYDYLKFIGEIRGLSGARLRERITIVSQKVGIGHVLGQVIGTLSKGYRQRVCLAQALIHDPEILILDEPTVGLDPNQVVEIRSLIKELGKEHTVILSTHILPEVLVTCDRIIIIHRGRIAADGTPKHLLEQHTSNPPVIVTLRGDETMQAAVESAFGNQPWIQRFRKRNSGLSGELEFELVAAGGVDIRAQVVSLAETNRWQLLEVRREMLDLEGLFRKLTQE